ncbi:MAG TPA: hypothetical protein PKN60_03935 [Bacteroidales bacterium]|nr:hypothetical protein [Bacteroidales bacterium]
MTADSPCREASLHSYYRGRGDGCFAPQRSVVTLSCQGCDDS